MFEVYAKTFYGYYSWLNERTWMTSAGLSDQIIWIMTVIEFLYLIAGRTLLSPFFSFESSGDAPNFVVPASVFVVILFGNYYFFRRVHTYERIIEEFSRKISIVEKGRLELIAKVVAAGALLMPVASVIADAWFYGN